MDQGQTVVTAQGARGPHTFSHPHPVPSHSAVPILSASCCLLPFRYAHPRKPHGPKSREQNRSAPPRPVGHFSLSHAKAFFFNEALERHHQLLYLGSSPSQTNEQKEASLPFPTPAAAAAALRLSPHPIFLRPTVNPSRRARDYIGLGAAGSSSSSSSCSGVVEGAAGPHLALRLGLPGSESPGRGAEAAEHVDAALTLGPAPARGGAKRGFADSLDLPAKRDAGASPDAAGDVSREEKGVAETAAGAPRAAK
ncbi:hypothetical protein HU200_019139 [Digitaria exilis]|uniref:Uncharacterized protein n=1 Tax=Digitaria exilis TaxID=1010633 RepID=A0A835KHS8_9POAL|nr:hypothetical protein HU200_019139 [Digitaria exilis]